MDTIRLPTPKYSVIWEVQPVVDCSKNLGDDERLSNKDLTLKPTIFENNMQMFQGEYRQENRDSSFIADINLVKGYKSNSLNKKSTLTHFFSKYEKDLNFTNYLKSFLAFDYYVLQSYQIF